MDLLSQDLIPKKEKSENPKLNSEAELSDYINSARAFAKIANYFEQNKVQNFLEFKFFGITARWMDIYFEDWGKVYEKKYKVAEGIGLFTRFFCISRSTL